MNAITERSWSGATLRSVSFDLDSRTLVLELYAQSGARCDRIVITNGDVALSGSLDFSSGPAHCLVAEPSWVPTRGVGTLTFTTPTLAITVSGGMASVDSWAVDEDAMPLWLSDADGLDEAIASMPWSGEWRRAA